MYSQKKKILLWLFVVMLIILTACKNNIEKFYSESHEVGAITVPIIYPCFIESNNGLNGPWHIYDVNIRNWDSDFGQLHYIDLVDSVLVAKYFDKYLNPSIRKDTVWLICMPTIDSSCFIYSREQFDETLKKLTNKEPKFRTPSDVWLDFDGNGYLKCFPQSTFYMREANILNKPLAEHRYW
ncbi:MAG: hypothetical protein JHD28_09955 [Bacteroidia bacterium]|nr:hypothetical protein [Bacteroidia bacterium]